MEYNEELSGKHSAAIVAILKTIGIETGSVFVDYKLFEGSQILKLDFSATDPDEIVRSAIQQAYRAGFSNGEKDAQCVMREALGL